MKKIFFNILTITILLFLAPSCDDILDQQPVDKFNEEQVFTDINVVNAYLNKCYDRMGGNTDNGILGNREDLLVSGTDQTLCIHRPARYVMIKGTMSPDDLQYFDQTNHGGYLRWTDLYANIQNVNKILDDVDKVPLKGGQEALPKQIKGEAYFIRAYDYATLLMVYGGAILQDKAFILGEDFLTIKRSTIKETLDFILKDIQSAIDNLPATVEQGRANRAAAAALKSRVLLFCASKLTNGGYEASNTLVSFPSGSQNGLLQQARDAAKDVMDGKYGNFSLIGTTIDPPSSMTQAEVQKYADTFYVVILIFGALFFDYFLSHFIIILFTIN